jgi:predicted DNA-binding protein (UPF0251 family)
VATVFKPAGVPARDLEWAQLTLDEFEVIRLVDGEGLDQESVAERMDVSRPTITRILASARGKIARVLVEGQALLIEGGPIVCVPGLGRGRGVGRGRGRGGRGGGQGGGPGGGRGGHGRGRCHRGGAGRPQEETE